MRIQIKKRDTVVSFFDSINVIVVPSICDQVGIFPEKFISQTLSLCTVDLVVFCKVFLSYSDTSPDHDCKIQRTQFHLSSPNEKI